MDHEAEVEFVSACMRLSGKHHLKEVDVDYILSVYKAKLAIEDEYEVLDLCPIREEVEARHDA